MVTQFMLGHFEKETGPALPRRRKESLFFRARHYPKIESLSLQHMQKQVEEAYNLLSQCAKIPEAVQPVDGMHLVGEVTNPPTMNLCKPKDQRNLAGFAEALVAYSAARKGLLLGPRP